MIINRITPLLFLLTIAFPFLGDELPVHKLLEKNLEEQDLTVTLPQKLPVESFIMPSQTQKSGGVPQKEVHVKDESQGWKTVTLTTPKIATNLTKTDEENEEVVIAKACKAANIELTVKAMREAKYCTTGKTRFVKFPTDGVLENSSKKVECHRFEKNLNYNNFNGARECTCLGSIQWRCEPIVKAYNSK